MCRPYAPAIRMAIEIMQSILICLSYGGMGLYTWIVHKCARWKKIKRKTDRKKKKSGKYMVLGVANTHKERKNYKNQKRGFFNCKEKKSLILGISRDAWRWRKKEQWSFVGEIGVWRLWMEKLSAARVRKREGGEGWRFFKKRDRVERWGELKVYVFWLHGRIVFKKYS